MVSFKSVAFYLCVRVFMCVFIQVSLRHKLQKSVDIRLSYCKNIKGAFFETQCMFMYGGLL